MLSEQQRRRVWEDWLSSEIRSNYFADLAYRYFRRQRIVTWVAVFSSSAAFFALVSASELISPWITKGLALITAALSAYALVMQYQKTAIETAELHARWNKLASEYEQLWDNLYNDDAPQILSDLVAKEGELSKIATAFPARKDLLEKWQTHVEQHHSSQRPVSAT